MTVIFGDHGIHAQNAPRLHRALLPQPTHTNGLSFVSLCPCGDKIGLQASATSFKMHRLSGARIDSFQKTPGAFFK
ncbi:MAG TPA: hypothetical protein PLA28_04505 [Ottowia sp.]|nr:hypothetical protein [Ottowia sp.]